MANPESRYGGRKRHPLNLLLILTLGLIIYSNTFHVPFIFDDKAYIVENPIITDHYFFTGKTGIEDYVVRDNVKHSHRTRYIGYLSFYLNYALHGLNVTGYHIANLIIHVLNASLLYLFIVLAFKTPFLIRSRLVDKSHTIALFTALLFVSHPIHTQAVTYISQRFASLATFFYLSSLVSYTGSRLSSSRKGKYGLYAASLISAVIAMKTKEIAFTIPVLIALFEFLFFRSALQKRVILLLPFILTIAVIPFSLMELDKPLEEAISDSMRTQHEISHYGYFVTQIRALATYLRLLLFPINQNLDYDYPVFTSFLNPNVIASLVLTAALLGLGLYFLRQSRNDIPELRLSAFGIFWFFITISVESSFIALADVMFEHRVYLPSAGLFASIVTCAYLMKDMFRAKKSGQALIGMLALLVTIFAFTAHLRNYTWHDSVVFYEDAAKKSPNKARVHNNLGYAYGEAGLNDKAIEQFRISLSMEPDDAEVAFNLGLAYLQNGNISSARREMEAALTLDPNNEEARKFLHYIGRIQEAEHQGLADRPSKD